MIEKLTILLLLFAIFFGPAIVLAILYAFTISRPCGGKPHDWRPHPGYFRSRICTRCARCETLGRGWEFDGYDKLARAAIAKATGIAS